MSRFRDEDFHSLTAPENWASLMRDEDERYERERWQEDKLQQADEQRRRLLADREIELAEFATPAQRERTRHRSET